MRELAQIRTELDGVDAQIVRLFEKRMHLAQEVAACKMARGLPVLDAAREERVLASRAEMLEEKRWSEGVKTLFRCLMALSRAEQQTMLKEEARHD